MKAWTRRGAPGTLKLPTWDQIHKSECQRMADLIAALSWKDPDLRRELSKYLARLQRQALSSE